VATGKLIKTFIWLKLKFYAKNFIGYVKVISYKSCIHLFKALKKFSIILAKAELDILSIRRYSCI